MRILTLLSPSVLLWQQFAGPYLNQIRELIRVYYFPGLFLNLEPLIAVVYSTAPQAAGISQPRGFRLSSGLGTSTWGGHKLHELVWLLAPPVPHSDFSDRSVIVFSQPLVGSSNSYCSSLLCLSLWGVLGPLIAVMRTKKNIMIQREIWKCSSKSDVWNTRAKRCMWSAG